MLSRGQGAGARPANGRARAAAGPASAGPGRAGRSAAGRRGKSFFCGQKGLRRADAARTAAVPQPAFLFRFPLAAPGLEKASPLGVKERSSPRSAGGGRARARGRIAGSHPGWKFVPGSGRAPAAGRRAEREAAGPRWARRGSARPRRRWGCCCARRWDPRDRPRAAAARSPPSACALLPAAASGTCWTAVAGGWRTFPSRSRPGSLGCKYSPEGGGGAGAGPGRLARSSFSPGSASWPGPPAALGGDAEERSGPQSPLPSASRAALGGPWRDSPRRRWARGGIH